MPPKVTVKILQGTPGSGKSTYVRVMTKDDGYNEYFSSDEYFVTGGVYIFDHTKLDAAHSWCVRQFVEEIYLLHQEIREGKLKNDFVIWVDNTNTTITDIAPYYSVAHAYGAEVEIIRFVCEPAVCAARNIHGVPEKTINKMLNRLKQISYPSTWEYKLTIINTNPTDEGDNGE
jgi:predicted kinase